MNKDIFFCRFFSFLFSCAVVEHVCVIHHRMTLFLLFHPPEIESSNVYLESFESELR
ncbi:hypothetical protein AOQ84DRAFT_213056 [Glonium stellatum]|uniref:Uncharacterized protein n=1 Tax=Glonium stellatum TaxID=574774 RepID=A0A8E2ENE3_9PEZI|nr:hypothetical protein AOQ84DRAFT_213056 [Glonium stellatum]